MTRFRYDSATEGREEEVTLISKTQLKHEADAYQTLGLALLELPAERLARLELSERLREALEELARIENHGARRRQAQYIGKLLREEDIAPFEAALAAWRRGQAEAAKGFPDLARWRDRLLESDAVLTEWCARYPLTDTRALRTLMRNARKEAAEAAANGSTEKGRHYRALFQALKAAADDVHHAG
jgi:ribosome-associated protein